jgi:hypothetical protein
MSWLLQAIRKERQAKLEVELRAALESLQKLECTLCT